MFDNISPDLEIALTYLVWIVALFLVVLAACAGILVYKLVHLSTSVNKLVDDVDTELVPTMKEMQVTLKHVSAISDKADKHISEISDTIEATQKSTSTAVRQAHIGVLSTAAGITEGVRRLFANDKKESRI